MQPFLLHGQVCKWNSLHLQQHPMFLWVPHQTRKTHCIFLPAATVTGGDSSDKCCLSSTTCMCKQKSSWKYGIVPPKFLGDMPKKSQTSQNFNFVTSCLPENFQSLPIPSKIFRFPEEFCFSLETILLRVETQVTVETLRVTLSSYQF